MRLVSFATSLAILAGPIVGASPADLEVSLDLAKTRAPISKYVYGQFIEHLGRCIYGGLWAEMLEDRKFYYPVDGEAPAWAMQFPRPISWEGDGYPYELLVRSPWMIVGDKKAVTLDRERPFTGEHTPVVAATPQGNGLFQERLGLVRGRRYLARVVLAGGSEAGPVHVALTWGTGASDRESLAVKRLTPEYESTTLTFAAQGSTDNGRLEIVGYGKGAFRIGAVSLMPADNVQGWRADTLARLEELNSPVYRWPGGNFVSGYDWKDGIGDRDRRPPRKNPAWKGIEPNDVGIDEFMVLCREIGAEPYIAVNTGLGGAEAAAGEVQYLNGAPSTAMGKRRADNGHPKPYGVKWRVVDAMRAVDPKIVPIAVGAVGEWTKEMLTRSVAHMELLSEHTYWQSKPDLPAHVEQAAVAIRTIADAHRAYRRDLPSLKGKDIRIALDEWNYWYGPNEYGELGTRYFLQDGLGAAAALHEMFRNSDLFFMANYAQTVNVIGAIKTTPTAAEMETTGLVQQLYRARFGVTPVDVTGDLRPLDAAAALSEDGRALTLGVVNPTDEAQRLRLKVTGGALAGSGQKWVITGKDRWAHNRPGVPRGVDITTEAVEGVTEAADVGPLSVTLYSLWLR